jgi:hypothetical protein
MTRSNARNNNRQTPLKPAHLSSVHGDERVIERDSSWLFLFYGILDNLKIRERVMPEQNLTQVLRHCLEGGN